MAAIADLSEEERYLLAILQDQSGIDQAEFLWTDDTADDMVFRCWDFQYAWYRDNSKFQIDQAGRAVGKSVGMQMRSWAFPFTNPGEEMLLTAPELIHLDPITRAVEDRIMSVRLSREFLKTGSGGVTGFTHRPFRAEFRNGARIVGRIPQKDGKGVKGQHPLKLEMDEGQDYPEAGWVELGETLKYANPNATWRTHGVSRGVRDRYYKQTQPESGWKVHRITAMHREDWGPEERAAKAELYGSRDHPDYRRNILGLHGDAMSSLFVLTRLMQCVDQNQGSPYNTDVYAHIRINDERLRDVGLPIEALLEFPGSHKGFARTWVGMDVGMTNHPSEILILGEEPMQKRKGDAPAIRLRALSRIHLERISAPDQRMAMEMVWDYYRPQAFSMDRTGLGLPIFSEIVNGDNHGFARALKGYNFSEKVIVGYNDMEIDDDTGYGEPIMANVLEYSSDVLRLLVDQERLMLPWDIDLLREFQGQTYTVHKSNTDAYGKKQFNKGKFHALDAARMAVLAYSLELVDGMKRVVDDEPVFDMFLI